MLGPGLNLFFTQFFFPQAHPFATKSIHSKVLDDCPPNVFAMLKSICRSIVDQTFFIFHLE